MEKDLDYRGYTVSWDGDRYVARVSNSFEDTGIDMLTGDDSSNIYEMSSTNLGRLLIDIDRLHRVSDALGVIPDFFRDWIANGSNGRVNLDTYNSDDSHDMFRQRVYQLAERYGLRLEFELMVPSPGERPMELVRMSLDGQSVGEVTIDPYGDQFANKTLWHSVFWAAQRAMA